MAALSLPLVAPIAAIAWTSAGARPPPMGAMVASARIIFFVSVLAALRTSGWCLRRSRLIDVSRRVDECYVFALADWYCIKPRASCSDATGCSKTALFTNRRQRHAKTHEDTRRATAGQLASVV